MSKNYKGTVTACSIAAMVQALVINFVPLLYLHFHNFYGVSLGRISLLISFSFFIQLTVDVTSLKFLKAFGYRICGAVGQLVSFLGLILLSVVPRLPFDFFTGLLIATVFYSLGGGLVEVVNGPVVEGCPFENKEKVMSFVHSFYCWGQVLVVILSTLGFLLLGLEKWQIISVFWSVIPLFNFFLFLKVPVNALEGERNNMKIKELICSDIFIAFVIIMICAAAAEQAMSQWASAFAESGLRVSKTVGDLAGPCLFAALMGVARSLYSGYRGRIPLIYFLGASAVLCVIGFMMATLTGNAVIGLTGCGITGFAVGIMWPGTISGCAQRLPGGGEKMFSLLALSGDIGCILGPALVGFVSEKNGGLSSGLLSGAVFPAVMIFAVLYIIKKEKRV